MSQGQYVFTQLCSFLPKCVFDCLVDKYDGNKWVKSFTCWHHLLVMVFGQLSNRMSMRDLIVTLNAHRSKFYRLGLGKSVTRSNLSKANEVREARIFKEYADRLIGIARRKRDGLKEFFVKNKVFAFDSTTISLCLSVYWWTKLHHSKGGVKAHTLYDVKTDVPAFVIITDASVHDSKVMGEIPYEADAIYIFDRAYMDTAQLYAIALLKAFFVVREKHKMKFKITEDKRYNNPATGIMADQIVRFTAAKTKNKYPETIRRVVYYDGIGNRTFVFYTNNTDISAEDIAELYKNSWSVELFFKWLKQHLHIKEFYGTSENAVNIQIYSAIITYCLVAIVGNELNLKMSTYELLRIIGVSLFDKTPLRELLDDEPTEDANGNDQQLWFEFED
ncbi:MAG: IS4 family transposase [Prevotella sp.]|nr:IS4 family transposase [Prevotella sp.]